MKFYKLSELDLPLIVSLNESEIKVWCWLSINLPFENSKNLEIDTSQLAEELSMSRRSVQRALKKLQEDEIFDIEFTKAKVKRKTSQMSSNDTDVVETSQMSPKRHGCRQNVTDVAETSQMSSTQAETFTEQAFQDSKIIQTYSDFKKTLSDDERERFENFCIKKISECEFKIEIPSKWLDKYHLDYWEEFKTRFSQNSQSPQSTSETPSLQYLKNFHRGRIEAFKEAATHEGYSVEEIEEFLEVGNHG